MTECSKGWGERCASATSKRCRCQCGGENHGKSRATYIPGWSDEGRVFLPDQPNGVVTLTRTIGDLPYVSGVAHEIVAHSPDGFEWGYGGSGPADLALNILAMVVPPTEAFRLHQDFKWDVIARVPREARGTTISFDLVRSWVKRQWTQEGVAVGAV